MGSATAAKQPPIVVDIETTSQPSTPAVSQATGLALVVERLALHPDVDVAKLEKIIELQERIMRHAASAAFNAAFSAMQPKIPVIIERGQTDKGKFAELEDIVEAVRPVLAEFGFAISHKTEWPAPNQVRIVGFLKHREGHQETSEFLSAPDTSGSKNGIQALGSAVSYGRRYTTKDLLCIVSRGEGKDDGHHTSAASAPEGYQDWATDLQSVADEGLAKLQQTWSVSKPDYKRHLLRTDNRGWEALKKRAAKVQS